jgi:hypothetical protein
MKRVFNNNLELLKHPYIFGKTAGCTNHNICDYNFEYPCSLLVVLKDRVLAQFLHHLLGNGLDPQHTKYRRRV